MRHFKKQLIAWQKATCGPKEEPKKPPVKVKKYPTQKPRELVAGGEVKWKPVNREAAMLIAKAPWWAHPIHEKKFESPELEKASTGNSANPKGSKKKAGSRKSKRTMKNSVSETVMMSDTPSGLSNKEYVSDSGVRVKYVNGEPLINLDDIQRLLCEEVAKLPKETRPNVRAAEDARRIIAELTDGIGGDMDKFRADTKRYLEDIRNTRFAVVGETAQMTSSLKEVRQFFLGGEYREEIVRLKEFVDLCERLQKLKESGFLDNVADTMLRLAVVQ